MKVDGITLLQMIKDGEIGEGVKFKRVGYEGTKCELNELNQLIWISGDCTGDYVNSYAFLTHTFELIDNEIEIIEEDKPIEKLRPFTNQEILEDSIRVIREMCHKMEELRNKVNELEKRGNE